MKCFKPGTGDHLTLVHVHQPRTQAPRVLGRGVAVLGRRVRWPHRVNGYLGRHARGVSLLGALSTKWSNVGPVLSVSSLSANFAFRLYPGTNVGKPQVATVGKRTGGGDVVRCRLWRCRSDVDRAVILRM